MPISRSALSLIWLSLFFAFLVIKLHAEDNPFADHEESNESAFLAYERIVDIIGEEFGSFKVSRIELSAKKDWLSHQIQAVRSKNGDDLKRLWLLYILEKNDVHIGTNVSAYTRMDLLSLDELVKSSFTEEYDREIGLIRTASASQVSYWWPIIRDISRPEIREIAKTVFQAEGLYGKMSLYGEEADAIDAKEIALRSDCQKLLEMLGPSMEQIFLKLEFKELSVISRQSASPAEEEEVAQWFKRYDRYVWEHSIGTHKTSLKFYSVFISWLLEVKKAAYALTPKQEYEPLGDRLTWQSIREIRLTPSKRAALPQQLRVPIIMFSLPDLDSILASDISRYSRDLKQFSLQRGFLQQRSSFYEEELHRMYKGAAELGLYEPAINYVRAELGLAKNAGMAWADMNPKHISAAADILVPVEHLRSYFRPIASFIPVSENEKFLNESLLSVLQAEIRDSEERTGQSLEGNGDLVVALRNESDVEESVSDFEILFEAGNDLMSMYAVRGRLLNLKANLQIEKDALEATLSKHDQKSLDRSRSRRIIEKQSNMTTSRHSHTIDSAYSELRRRSNWLMSYRDQDGSGALVPLTTLELMDDVLEELNREIDSKGKVITSAFRGHEVSLQLLEGLAEVGGMNSNSLEFYELFSVLVPFLDYKSSDNETTLALLKEMHSEHGTHNDAAQDIEGELRDIFLRSGLTLIVDLIDIWRGLEGTHSQFQVAPGLDDLFSINHKLRVLFYTGEVKLSKYAQGFGSDREILDNIITRGSQDGSYRIINVPIAAPRAYEFLLEEKINLPIDERQLYAHQVSMLTASERHRYEILWQADWIQKLSLDIRDYTRLVLLLSLLNEVEVSNVKDSIRYFAEKRYVLNSRSSRYLYTRRSRSQVEDSGFNKLRIKLDSRGRVRLPTADEITVRRSLVPPLKSIFKYYSEEEMKKLQINQRLKRASENIQADPVVSLRRASLEEIRSLNEDILGMSFFNEARVALKYKEAVEASELSEKIIDKLGRELDRKLGAEDVAAYTWLYQNVSAGLPNSSKLYMERLNRLGVEEIRALLEGKVD